MPLYEYKCSKCNKTYEQFNHLADRKNAFCCDTRSKKLITATRSTPVILEGFDENLNAYVTGPKQRKALMKSKDLEEA